MYVVKSSRNYAGIRELAFFFILGISAIVLSLILRIDWEKVKFLREFSLKEGFLISQ